MKKFLSLMLAVLLVASLAVPASAAVPADTKTGIGSISYGELANNTVAAAEDCAIFYHDTYYGASVVQGKSLQIPVYLFGGDSSLHAEFLLTDSNGDPVSSSSPVTWPMPASNTACDVKDYTFDATSLPVGEYTLLFAIFNSKEEVVGTVGFCPLYVVAKEVPLEDAMFFPVPMSDGDYCPLITNDIIHVDQASTTFYSLSLFPENTTDSRDYVFKSSNPDVVAVNDFCGMLAIRGLKEGSATITASCDTHTVATLEIVVSCVEEACVDVDADDWFHKAVDYNVYYQFMKGTKLNPLTFEPETILTRQQVAQLYYQLEGEPSFSVADYTGTKYPDVDDNDFYAKAIYWATENGIVTGDTEGTYRPTDPITRQEMFSSLYRYVNGCGLIGDWFSAGDTALLEDYPDADSVESWATAPIGWVLENQLVNGKDGRLAPNDNLQRCELAQLIMKLMCQWPLDE